MLGRAERVSPFLRTVLSRSELRSQVKSNKSTNVNLYITYPSCFAVTFRHIASVYVNVLYLFKIVEGNKMLFCVASVGRFLSRDQRLPNVKLSLSVTVAVNNLNK